MACREYEDELSELAAGGLAPVREAHVRAHVVGCAACREALEMETHLYVAVDAVLREEINAEAPASLAARIRIAAEAERVKPRVAWWRWGAVAGTALIAAVVVLTLVRGNKSSRAPEQPIQPAEVTEKLTPPGSVETEVARQQLARRRVRVAPTPKHAKAALGSRGPEVLVPSGEQQALLKWMAKREHWREEVRVEAVRVAFDAPFEIAPLEVKPLVEEEPQ